MSAGLYWNGRNYVSAAEFRRPPPAPANTKPPRKTPPEPQPKETENVDK